MSLSLIFLIVIFEFTALYVLLLLPFREQLKRSSQRISAVIGLCFVGVLAISIGLIDQSATMNNHFRILYGLVSSFCILAYAVRAPLWARLFDIFIVSCFVGDIHFFVWIVQKTSAGILPMSSLNFTYLYMYSFIYLISLPLIVLYIKKWVRPFLQIGEPIHHINKFWCLPFSFFLLYYIFQSVIITNAADISQTSYYLVFIGHVSWTLGTFLSCGMLMQMLREWINVHTYQSKLDTTALHLRMQRREYERLVETINNTRKLRHDMRHHMALINGLAQKGDDQGIAKYT